MMSMKSTKKMNDNYKHLKTAANLKFAAVLVSIHPNIAYLTLPCGSMCFRDNTLITI